MQARGMSMPLRARTRKPFRTCKSSRRTAATPSRASISCARSGASIRVSRAACTCISAKARPSRRVIRRRCSIWRADLLADQSPLIHILRRPPDASAASEPSAVERWPAVTERLRQYAGARQQRESAERCEFCGVAIAAEHAHLVDVPRRMLLCVCRPCYLLFTHDGAGGVRFRAVPERYGLVPELASAREGWEGLDIPVGLAFLFRNSATGRITAFYPSPAGATESELGLDAWNALVGAAPSLATLAADVEALLVRRTDQGMDA